MLILDQLTNDPRQKVKFVLEDGSTFSLSIYFIPMQLGWFITELTYKDFVLNGVRIVNSPNILHQFRNQIPFGLACFSTQEREPSQQNDFLSGASVLYVLSQDEVLQYAELLGGIQI